MSYAEPLSESLVKILFTRWWGRAIVAAAFLALAGSAVWACVAWGRRHDAEALKSQTEAAKIRAEAERTAAQTKQREPSPSADEPLLQDLLKHRREENKLLEQKVEERE